MLPHSARKMSTSQLNSSPQHSPHGGDQEGATSDAGSDDELTTTEPTLEARAQELVIRGKSLNSSDAFSQEAFEVLSKAIKLNPYLLEAWIELTKCYQKKSDFEGAMACLENALKYCESDKPNKVILRKLSTCVRQQTCESQEAKIAALLRSLDLSKQALKADLYDEENYYNLAKAYMCLFFVTECVDQQLINLSRAAYNKALVLSQEASVKRNKSLALEKENEADVVEPKVADFGDRTKPFMEQSDFLFNYSTVLIYLQDFQKALEYLNLAIELDPDWTELRVLGECLVDYLKQIQTMMVELSKNTKKVIRRYSKVVEGLKNLEKIETHIKSDQQRLNQSHEVHLISVSLERLQNNFDQNADNQMETKKHSNNQKQSTDLHGGGTADCDTDSKVQLLHLKLINMINYNQAMYLTFVAIDQNYSLIVVTIYNLAASRCPTPRDVVTIVNPKIEQIEVHAETISPRSITNQRQISYKRINVRDFKDFYVNGDRISRDQVSKPRFSVSVLP